MKGIFFHTPSFVYKGETGPTGGAPDAPKTPEAPPSSDITKDNADAEKNLKNAAQQPPATPTKPKTENQDDINKVVPATGEEDRRDFRVHAKPAARNTAPRPRLKFNAAGKRVDTPPPTTNAPTTGSHEKPPETPTSDTPKPPEKPRDPDREYRTYHRADGSKETVSRRNGGAWRTASSDGKRERIILGQDQNIHPETPIQPSKNTAPAKALQTPPPSTPKQTPPAPSKDKQSPSEGAKVSEPAQKTPAAPERKAVKGISPIESTEELHQPVSPENKESPKTATPKKDQKAKTYEEEDADFQTRMNRGDYEGSPTAFKAGLEHAERVDALRSGTETKKETKTPPLTEEEKISTSKPEESKKTKSLSEPDLQSDKGILTPPITEKPKPAEAEKASTTDAPLSAEEVKATPATEASKSTPPLPVDTEQSNETVITVNGSSIPLTRESPDAAWRDRDGVPYGDTLVAGSMKKNPAETPATKTTSEPTKPPGPESPRAQSEPQGKIIKGLGSENPKNTPAASENSPESNPLPIPSESNAPTATPASPQTNKRPRIKIGGFGPGSPEEKEYLAKEKNFSENINNGSYVQPNSTGEKELTPQGRQAFRELIATEHDYLPSAAFNEATAGQGLPTDPEDQEKALIAQEKLFLQNQDKHQKLKDLESEPTIVTATRSSRAQANPLNGGEQTINFRADRAEITSPDGNPRTVKDWLGWKPQTKMVTRTIEGKTETKEEIIPDRPSLYVYSAEEDAAGNPRFSGRVLHPSQVLESEGRYDNLYTANMDIDGDGVAEEVRIVPVAKRAKGYAHSLGRGDAAVGPSQPAVLIPKKPEKKEEVKIPKLPPIRYL